MSVEELMIEVRSRLDQITHHINQLPPVETLTDETYAKLLPMLKQANERLSIFVESLPKSYMPDADINKTSEFVSVLGSDSRTPLELFRGAASIIYGRYEDQLSSAQYESAHAIETISDELIHIIKSFNR